MVTIQTKHGYSVNCFGSCNEFSSIDACFDDEWFDACFVDGFKNWREAVKAISEYAHRNGTELVELEAD